MMHRSRKPGYSPARPCAWAMWRYSSKRPMQGLRFQNSTGPSLRHRWCWRMAPFFALVIQNPAPRIAAHTAMKSYVMRVFIACGAREAERSGFVRSAAMQPNTLVRSGVRKNLCSSCSTRRSSCHSCTRSDTVKRSRRLVWEEHASARPRVRCRQTRRG